MKRTARNILQGMYDSKPPNSKPPNSKPLDKPKRMDIHEYYLRMALLAKERSTCNRRSVGTVLTNNKNRVVSIGYNGVPSGRIHCINSPCLGANGESGKDLDMCEAIHAEISAIAACADIDDIHNAYSTVSPCIHCVKALLATSCQNIYFIEEYPHSYSIEMWLNNNRNWNHYSLGEEY